MKEFWLCFVPLFVAVDAIGILPMFIGLTEGIDRPRRRKVILQSIATALAVSVAFLVGGAWLLGALGMAVGDFMVAGGLLLFFFSLSDLLASTKIHRAVDPESLGAVPLGMPLIAGPAVFTTSLLLSKSHGLWLTALSVTANVLIAGIVLWHADVLHGWLGKAGAKTVSKMASLLLASIGVMMVRKGVMAIGAM